MISYALIFFQAAIVGIWMQENQSGNITDKIQKSSMACRGMAVTRK